MAKWFRRKKKKPAPESESTGRIGQPKDPGNQALQPSYLDRPEEAGRAQRSEAPRPDRGRESRPAAQPRPARANAPAQRHQAPPERRHQSAQGQRYQTPEGQRYQTEVQPESPATPPAAPSQATGGQPARAPKGVVVLAIGLPGSGKTTWFKRRGVTPLSSDMLRSILFDDITEQRYQSLVFSTLRSLLRARLVAKMPWNYVDATNLSPKERKQWIQMARSMGYEVQAVFFDVPLEVCLERNRKRERRVAEDVMHRMAAKLKAPTFEEGFAKILVVRVKNRPEDGAAHSGHEPDDEASW